MAKSFQMQVIITDVPETTEVNAKINLVGLPDNMEHMREIMDTFQEVWPNLRKNAETSISELLKKKGGQHG